jgi:chorismate mutase
MDRTPQQCRDMPELRAQIDRLDRELVAMLAMRQRYIERCIAHEFAQFDGRKGVTA